MRKTLSSTFVSAALLADLFLGMPLASAAAVPSSEAIGYAVEHGILSTDIEGNFQPTGTVTRLEFTLAVVGRFYGNADFENCFRNLSPKLPVRFTKLFSDVNKTEPYGEELCVAMFSGLVSGNARGAFEPMRAITIGEASKIMATANGLTYPNLKGATHPWYWSSMTALSLHGALDERANPASTLTRIEMAQMFYALRNIQRYPESRIIGLRAPKTPVAQNLPAAPVTDVALLVTPVVSKEDKAEPKLTVTESSAGGGRRALRRVSRRTLRQEVLAAAKTRGNP